MVWHSIMENSGKCFLISFFLIICTFLFAAKDSLCRRPVEESGDGSESSLKLNPEPWDEVFLWPKSSFHTSESHPWKSLTYCRPLRSSLYCLLCFTWNRQHLHCNRCVFNLYCGQNLTVCSVVIQCRIIELYLAF